MECVSSSWRGLWRPEEDEDRGLSELEPGWGLRTCSRLDSGLPRTRGCSSPAQSPWAAGNLNSPQSGGTKQETPGEATEGNLLRATEPSVPAGWWGSPDGAVHRQRAAIHWASEPLAVEQRGADR